MKSDQFDLAYIQALLAPLKGALNTHASLPSLNHVWFTGTHVLVYGGVVGVKLEQSTEFIGGLAGQQLYALLSSKTGGVVEFVQDAGVLTIKIGRSRTKMSFLSIDEMAWPFPDADDGDSVGLDAEFVSALKSVCVVNPKKPTRVEHYGILLVAEQHAGCLYSTDSVSLASSAVSSAFDKVLLPRPFVNYVLKYADPMQSKLTLCKDYLVTDWGMPKTYSHLLDVSEAIDLGQVTDNLLKNFSTAVPLPPALKEALERAQALSGESDARVTLKLRDTVLSVQGSYKTGELEEELDVEHGHPAYTISVQVDLVLRGLRDATDIAFNNKALLLLSTKPDGCMSTYIVAAA